MDIQNREATLHGWLTLVSADYSGGVRNLQTRPPWGDSGRLPISPLRICCCTALTN